MIRIELETFEVSLLSSLLREYIDKIDCGTISYGSEEDNREYKQDYEKILNKLK